MAGANDMDLSDDDNGNVAVGRLPQFGEDFEDDLPPKRTTRGGRGRKRRYDEVNGDADEDADFVDAYSAPTAASSSSQGRRKTMPASLPTKRGRASQDTGSDNENEVPEGQLPIPALSAGMRQRIDQICQLQANVKRPTNSVCVTAAAPAHPPADGACRRTRRRRGSLRR